MMEQEGKAQDAKNATKAGDKANVRKTVASIISRVTKIAASEITGEKMIRDDLGVDSMQAIESLAVIEKELGIVIDPDKAFMVATINDLFALVEESISRPFGAGAA
jgi:acyl carrier protein